jgi:hypothetical protein
MTSDEMREAFPGLAQADLDEMRAGDADSMQATDRDGTVCLIWWDAGSGLFLATDNF